MSPSDQGQREKNLEEGELNQNDRRSEKGHVVLDMRVLLRLAWVVGGDGEGGQEPQKPGLQDLLGPSHQKGKIVSPGKTAMPLGERRGFKKKNRRSERCKKAPTSVG